MRWSPKSSEDAPQLAAGRFIMWRSQKVEASIGYLTANFRPGVPNGQVSPPISGLQLRPPEMTQAGLRKGEELLSERRLRREILIVWLSLTFCFNPHPTLRPGAT